MKPLIVYVHGAGATPRSFSFIRAMLPEHDALLFAYDTNQSSQLAVDALAALVKAQDRPVNVVAHSLGGVIAVNASYQSEIAKIFTIASPFGGSKAANFLRWIFNSTLLDEINPYSFLIRATTGRKPTATVRSLVTTGGMLPFMREPNDGVVTVDSQRSLPGAEYVELKTNHFEALLANETVDFIKSFIFES